MADAARGAVVVGGGVGGMAAALRLRAAGHEVTLLERRDRLGGKLDSLERDGFTFDVGPSLLTLPEVFEDLVACAGRRLRDELRLVRLDPACRYRFADGSGFDARAAEADSAAEVDRLRRGNGAEWMAFHARSRRILEVARRTFLSGPVEAPAALLGRRGGPGDLLAIDPFVTLATRARHSFSDPRLRQWAERYATYSGSSPSRVPATLACIAALEQDGGCWYVCGGLGALRDLLERLLREVGVTVRTGAEVAAVTVSGGAVAGVRLRDGEPLAARTVVANVDAAHLYADLLPHAASLRRLRAAGRSSSGFVLLLGLEGRTPGLAHHTVLFSADYRAEFDDIHRRRRPPLEPTVYVCCSAVTDPGRAPDGCENWYVLVNVPAGGACDWAREAPAYRDRILELLARRGLEVRDRLRFAETVHPAHLAERFATPGGAIYGTSSNGRRAAFLRPGNRGPVPGLFLAGGSSHPGGGLPLVALSGAIAARLADAHLRSLR